MSQNSSSDNDGVEESSSSLDKDGTAGGKEEEEEVVAVRPPQKFHTLTVCMVPPPSSEEEDDDDETSPTTSSGSSTTMVWKQVTKARSELRDPGFFRWPPHVNLLYPFVAIRDATTKQQHSSDNDSDGEEDDSSHTSSSSSSSLLQLNQDVLHRLRNATRQCEPFHCCLDAFGTFGGKQRGVLWLYPRTFRQQQETTNAATTTNSSDSVQDQTQQQHECLEPIVALQALLEEQFPTCTDQRKQGRFAPHMTVSHFASLQDARTAQEAVERWWPFCGGDSLSFLVDRIYLLERRGDAGQFLRVATIFLGTKLQNGIYLHDPPEPFPEMPREEDEWVRNERFKLKERRNRRGNNSWNKGQRRRQRRRDCDRGPSRSTDTPEVIAVKRAARKAKRERLEQEEEERLLRTMEATEQQSSSEQSGGEESEAD